MSALFADGFEGAIIGVTQMMNVDGYIIVYDRDICIDILMGRDEMNYEDAVEFFDFNVSGSYVGPNTPLYITLANHIDVLEIVSEDDCQ